MNINPTDNGVKTNAKTSTTTTIKSNEIIKVNTVDDQEENVFDVNQSGTGIHLPGTAKTIRNPSNNNTHFDTNDTKFPVNSQDTELSGETGEFLRVREAIEKKAFDWIEQELLSHFISKLANSNQQDNQLIITDDIEDDQHDDLNLDNSQNMWLMHAIGKKGFQLFVDMGQDIDPNLVEILIREVLEEKIASMIYNNDFFTNDTVEKQVPHLDIIEEPQIGVVQPQPQPSPRKSLEYLEQRKYDNRPQSLELATPVPTPPLLSPSYPPVHVHPVPQPQPQLQPQTVAVEQKPKIQYLVLEQEEDFSELDVTLEDEQQPEFDEGSFL